MKAHNANLVSVRHAAASGPCAISWRQICHFPFAPDDALFCFRLSAVQEADFRIHTSASCGVQDAMPRRQPRHHLGADVCG
jgi:hypothetical protein